MGDSERNAIIYATLVAKAWEDEAFRRQLLADPDKVCREEGMDISRSIRLEMREDTAQMTHVILPADHEDEAVAQLAGLLKTSLPLPRGHALVLLQNLPDLNYLVLPVNPGAVGVELTDEDLERLAAGGVTAVSTDVVANAVVAANGVAVANVAAASHAVVAAMAVCVLVLYPLTSPLLEPVPYRVRLLPAIP